MCVRTKARRRGLNPPPTVSPSPHCIPRPHPPTVPPPTIVFPIHVLPPPSRSRHREAERRQHADTRQYSNAATVATCALRHRHSNQNPSHGRHRKQSERLRWTSASTRGLAGALLFAAFLGAIAVPARSSATPLPTLPLLSASSPAAAYLRRRCLHQAWRLGALPPGAIPRNSLLAPCSRNRRLFDVVARRVVGRGTSGCAAAGGGRKTTLTSSRLHLFVPGPIEDALEPLETLWEFYTAREDIRDEMLRRGADVLRRNSVRAAAFLAAGVVAAEGLARAGLIGNKKRGEGLARYVRDHGRGRIESAARNARGGIVEEMAPHWVARQGVRAFKVYTHLPEKSKFAIAVSAGSVAGKSALSATVLAVRLTAVAFVSLEVLAFAGIIGEPGESLLNWVDDHRDDISEWSRRTQRFRRDIRRCLQSWDGIADVYSEAVGEEKVACLGFAGGVALGVIF